MDIIRNITNNTFLFSQQTFEIGMGGGVREAMDKQITASVGDFSLG